MRRAGRAAGAGLLLFACICSRPGVARGAAASPSAGSGRARGSCAVLTSGGEILEGRLLGFENGFLLLDVGGKTYEISPAKASGVYASAAEARKARSDPAWLASLFAAPARAPAPPAPSATGPKTNAGARKPAPPAPAPPRPRTAGPLPPGGSKLERDFIARAVPEDPGKQDAFFSRCLEEARLVAKDYTLQGEEVFRQRARVVGRVALRCAKDPRALLEPDKYRPLVLGVAFAREAALALGRRLRASEDEEERRVLARELRKKVGAIRLFGLLHLKVVAGSELPEREKAKVRARVQEIYQAMALPGGRHGRPGLRRPRPGEGFGRGR